MTESVVNLIKQAQQSGEPLFKGDVVGHEFHGNQYADKASEKAKEASLNNEKIGSEKSHNDALAAHRKAARAHEAAGNLERAKYHYKEAANLAAGVSKR